MPFGESASAVHVEVGMGKLEVLLLADVPVDIHARVGAGEAQLLDRMDHGLDVDTQVHADGSPGLGRLSLDLHVGLGNVHVRRAGAATLQGAL